MKTRLDILLVQRGLAETRVRAQSLIMGGGVVVDGRGVTKPAALIEKESLVALTNPPLAYVSRGGLKLRSALDLFDITVEGMVTADIGASTGGFTDVLLRGGASRVYAIDVGYGQLDWRLRNDPRVVVMERTNIRHVVDLPEHPALVAIDVSFISLRLVLPVAQRILSAEGDVVALVKPQFEVGRGQTKKGVVRDDELRRRTIRSILTFCRETGWSVLGLEQSPIRGAAGNIEYLVQLSPRPTQPCDLDRLVDRLG